MTAGLTLFPSLAPVRPEVMPLTASEEKLIGGHRDKPRFDRSEDGAKLAVGFPDNTVVIWNSFGGATPSLVHDALVNCVRFSPDGLRVVTSTASQMVRVWD